MEFMKLRVIAGYKTQAELVQALGVSQSSVSSWESGKRVPRPAQMFCMARLFGVDVGEVIKCFQNANKKE